MTREEIEGAVKFVESGPGFIDWSHMSILAAAARKQLALMPEKCEHGKVEPHWFGFDVTTKETCSGKVYPQETVEKIAKALMDAWQSDFDVYAIAVLDALGEMPQVAKDPPNGPEVYLPPSVQPR